MKKILQTGLISLLFLLIGCDLCYYCEEATYNFKPEELYVEVEEKKIYVSHFISGSIEGSGDESPAGTKFKLEYYWSKSSTDYISGTKIISAKGGAIIAKNNGGYWEFEDDIPTTQMPSEFQYVTNKTNERTLYISSFDLPSGLDNGTYYVHAIAKCSCEGEEGSAYINLGVITTIDLSVDIEVFPWSSVADFPSGSALSSVMQNDTVWVKASLSSTPAIPEIFSELSGSVTSKLGNITILSAAGGSDIKNALGNKANWYNSGDRFIYPAIFTESQYAPGAHDLSITVNQTTYNETSSANNTATKSIEVKELISETIEFESTFSQSDWSKMYKSIDWERSTFGPTGTYSSGMGPIKSTSQSDGFALYDSDVRGTTGYHYIYNNTLLSFNPSKETLSFEMEYYYRKFDDEVNYYVSFYNLDGVNIVNTIAYIDQNSSMSNNDITSNPQKVNWDLTSHIQYFYSQYPGITFYKIGIRYRDAQGYALMVDDFKVKKSSLVNGKLEENIAITRQYVLDHSLPLDIEEQDSRMNGKNSDLYKVSLEGKNRIKSKKTKSLR